jgi:hypothetical protein
MASARQRVALCLGLALFVAGSATGPVLAATRAGDGPLFSFPQAIREVQRILEKEKYLRPGDHQSGALDDATASALRAFQMDHFTLASGRVDTDTMGLLVSHGMRASFPGMAQARSAAPAGVRSTAPEERVTLTAATSPAAEAGTRSPARTVAERSMPGTGSPTVLAAVIGALLLGVGLAILFLRRI